MNAELYRRGVPAFVRVGQVVRAPAGEGIDGADWAFGLERSPVPLDDDATAERYAAALFTWEDEVDATAQWAAERFAVAWDEEAPHGAVFIPAPEPAAHPARRGEPVGARKAAGGE